MLGASRAALLLLVATGVTSVASVAGAQEPVSLAWNAPVGCPTGGAVLADMKAILGGPTPHRVTARADVTQLGPEHWSVHVATDVDGTQGERTLDADSCASLAKATALILAWAVDPVKARAAMATKQAEPATAPPAATPSAEQPPSSPSSPLSLAAVVAVSGMGDVGTLQSPGGGVQLALGALVGPLRFELTGGYWFEQDAAQQESGRPSVIVGSHIHLLDAGLRACFRWRLDARFELDPCAGAAIVHASSDGYATSSRSFVKASGTGDWAALHGDVLVAWRIIGPFALRASVGMELTPTRPQFTVTTVQPSEQLLHKPSLVGGTATLGVEAHFP
jgi:hypothetical protein